MKQQIFRNIRYSRWKRKTKREDFLLTTKSIIQWEEFGNKNMENINANGFRISILRNDK